MCRLGALTYLVTAVLLCATCEAEDVCAYFSTKDALAEIDGVPRGADFEACASYLHDSTPVCQLTCDSTSQSFRYIAGAGEIRCNATNLIAGTNSEPPFSYSGTLSCEDTSNGLDATSLVMDVDLSNLTAGKFILANVTVQSAVDGVLPVLDGEVCAELVDTPSADNNWAYLRSAEVQDVVLTSFANYSQFYEVNPDDPLEILPLVSSDIALNTSLLRGTFLLEFTHNKKTERTAQIPWNASAAEMQDALQELEEIHMITVTRHTEQAYRYEELGEHPYGTVVTGVTFTTTWSVTFRGELAGTDVELLNPQWKNNGCPECISFNDTQSNILSAQEQVPGSFWPCAPFVDGVASFQTLQINEIGEHAIHFYFDRWQVDGPAFNVSVGPAAAVLLQTEPGAAYGGTAFASQPTLAVTDLGGNHVPTVSTGSITVSLLFEYGRNEDDEFQYSVHNATNASIGPRSELTRRFDQGVASFRSLSIDKPGLYALLFESDLNLEWPSVIHHRQRVGVGSPAQLAIRYQPSSETAGVPFATQPVVELHDAAGNIVDWDSESRVLASIFANPCAGNIGGSGAVERTLFNRDWSLLNSSGCGTLMRSEVQRLSAYVMNVDIANISFDVGFQMGVKVTTGGQFDRFDFYGEDATITVPMNASAIEMRSLLESLPSIGFVSVEKSTQGDENYLLADWYVTFVSDKGNIPTLSMDCTGSPCSVAFNESVLNTSAPHVIATEVEEVVHGCLSPELCLDPEDFYVDHMAATAEEGVVTFSELSIDTVGTGYILQFELEGSNGSVVVLGDALDIELGSPTFLATTDIVATTATANGEALSIVPSVVVWDSGFNRITDLSTEDGFVVASVEAPVASVRAVEAYIDHGKNTQCVGAHDSVPTAWTALGVSAGVCRAICNSYEACSGYMTNSSSQSMKARQDVDPAGSQSCTLFVNTSQSDSFCEAATFTVTTDWNRTSFAVNGVDLAMSTDDDIADRPSQLYDFWSQEYGGGYALVTLASPCAPTEVLTARSFHADPNNPTETAEWQDALEVFITEDIAEGNVVLVSLEWQDLSNCDDWQGTGDAAVACPASSSAMSSLLGATVTPADVERCNAECSSIPGMGNCSYSLVAVKGMTSTGPGISEFLNCTRVVGCGFEVLYAAGGCETNQYQSFAHAEVLGNDYTLDECYEACRDIAWCENFAIGVQGSNRQGDCLVYSGTCSSQSDDSALITYQMLPCSARANITYANEWTQSTSASANMSEISGDFVQGAVNMTTEEAMRCYQKDFHASLDVRTGEWKQELRSGWANFSTMGFGRAGDYRIKFQFAQFIIDEDKGSGFRCPDTDAVLATDFSESASDCQAACVDIDNCHFAVYWSGYGATGFCELCEAPSIYYADGYYRGSAADLVPVDGSDARQGRRPVSSERYPTTVYVRLDFGDLREIVDASIRPSVEFVAKALTPHAGELLGSSVAIGEGGLVVAGAYGSSVPTYEVQYLRTTGVANVWGPEIQVLQVGVRDHSHEIQSITLTPNHFEDVGGSFTVSWNGRGPSRDLPFDISAVQLEKILEEDLTGIGDLEVSKLSNWQCDGGQCLHKWEITFVSVNETYLGCHAFSDGEGTARDGTACAYPFKVGDKVFTSCANGREEGGLVAAGGDPDRWWCSTTFDFDQDRMWGFCECPEFGSWPEISVNGDSLVGNTSCLDVWTSIPGHICKSYELEAINLDAASCESYALERNRQMFSFGVVENSTQCLLCDSEELLPSVAFNTSNHSQICSYDHPVLEVNTIQHAAVVGGTFTLQGEGNTSVEVNWNETRDVLLEKIESNLLTTDYLGNLSEIDVLEVNRGLPDSHGGYTWTITFNPSDTVYDIPELSILGQENYDPDVCLCEENCCNDTSQSIPGLLPEGNTEGTVYTISNGTAPLGEWFNLYFQGAGPTGDIPFNATAEEMEYALQQLATIDDVDVVVEASDTNSDRYGICREGSRCYEWSITFKRTRRKTEYGYVIDEFGNLPPLEADTTLLAGTDVGISIDYLYEGSPSLGQRAIRGDDGTRAGCVYVFVPNDVASDPDYRLNLPQSHSTSWAQQARLTSSDASAFDMFGYSVAVDGAVKVGFSVVDRPARIVVGAPGHAHAGHVDDLGRSLNQSVGAAYVFERRLNRSGSDYGSSVDVRHPDDTSSFEFDWVEVQMLQPDAEPNNDFGWGFGQSVAVHQDVIAVGAPQEGSDSGAVYIYHVENNIGDPDHGSWVEIQRLTAPAMELVGYTEPDSPGDNDTAPELFGSTVKIEDDLLVVSAPGMYGGLGAVFLYQWIDQEHSADLSYSTRPTYNQSSTYRHFSFLQRLLSPGASDTDPDVVAEARSSGFASSVAVCDEFVVVGAPTSFEGVGSAVVFARADDSAQFELAQVLQGSDGYANGHFGVDVAIDGRVIAVAAHEVTNNDLKPSATVQLVTIQAGNGVQMDAGASTFALGFRERALEADDQCYRGTSMRCPREEMNFRCYECAQDSSSVQQFVVLSTPRLPNDASAEAVRLALEDLGTGPLEVHRTVDPDSQGAFAWTVTFLDSHRFASKVPLLASFAGELQGFSTGTGIVVEAVSEAPQADDAVWTGVYTFSSRAIWPYQVTSGEHPFIEQGVLSPQNHQNDDRFGSALALAQGTLAVGAMNRALSPLEPNMNAGAVFVEQLQLLDIGVDSNAFAPFEDAIALDIVSKRCNGDCVPATLGQSMFEDLAPIVEGHPLVNFSGHSLRCYSPTDLNLPSDRDPTTDSVDSTVFTPYAHSVSEGTKEWVLRIESVSEDEPLRIGIAATHSLYAANHSHALADEITETYLLPSLGFAYEAQSGRLVNYSKFSQNGPSGLEFDSTVYGKSLKPGDLITVRLQLDTASTGTLEFVVNGVSTGVAARGLFDASSDPVVSYRLMVSITCGGSNDAQNHVTIEESNSVPIMFATGDEVSDSEIDDLLLRRAAWYLANVEGQSQYLPYGTAVSQSDCMTPIDAYQCLWQNGVYDYDGSSDYAPLNGTIHHVALDYNHQETISVMITDDDIVEEPDEFFNVVWWLPGFAPSLTGDFWSQVTIKDDGDGAVGVESLTSTIHSSEPSDSDFFGTCVDTAGNWMIVGAMHADNGAGQVDIFFNNLGVWTQTQVLTNSESPLVASGAVHGNKSYFGSALDLDLDNAQLIVGAYGEGAAYIFVLDSNNSTGNWTLEGRLSVPEVEQAPASSYFGWHNAVALSGSYAAVGAKGLESVYIFSFNETLQEWLLHQTLHSSDYHSYQATPVVSGVATTYVLQQEFGCSVSMSLTTLAVGARRANYVANRTLGQGGLSARGAVYTFFPHDQDYIGCFSDATDRDFEYEASARDDTMSISKCERLCSDFEYFAVQRGMNCYCSNNYPTRALADESLCDSRCTNNSDTSQCGGIWYNSVYRNVYYTHSNQSGLYWSQHSKLLSNDGVVEDFFGAVVAVDNDTLVVSSWKNPAMSHSTWGFENGDISGWLTTGNAFDNQPTFGENVLYRTVYGDKQINLTTSGVYVRWAHTHPFAFAGFDSDPNEFASTVSNQTTEEECTIECDSLSDACLGFLRTTTSSNTDIGLCTLIYRNDFEPVGIQESNVSHWSDGDMYLKEGAEPFFLYTKNTDRFARYFDYEGVQSNVRVHPAGNFWVGTFENHPHDGPVSEWGTFQGDEPTGTMASTPFIVGGSEISFLIGGGCDVRKIFVELIVDRQRVRVATGQCREEMQRVRWNVAEFKGKAAVLRIADLASGVWGHINFDDVQFSWRVEGLSGDFEADISLQTAGAGAAYVFRRHTADKPLEPCACTCSLDVPDFFKQTLSMRSGESFEEHCLCTNNKWDCQWSQEVKLEASDKAEQAYFGQAVAVSQEHGIIAIGAHKAHSQNQFSIDDRSADDDKFTKRGGTGAVYVYTRQDEYRDAFANQVHYASWAQDYAHATRGYSDLDEMQTDHAADPNFPTKLAVSTERVRLQSVGPRADGDMFGFSVAVADDRVVVGAPGASYSGYQHVPHSVGMIRPGATFAYNSEFRFVQFSQRSAVVAEADPGDHAVHEIGYRSVSHITWLAVELTRSGDASKSLHIGYSTSDITAVGVTPDEAAICLETPYRNRTSEICGDYVHSKGVVEFLPRETLAQIVIPIMDDECTEGAEAFQLQLNTVGGDPLLGELYHMVIEIDDNDFGSAEC